MLEAGERPPLLWYHIAIKTSHGHTQPRYGRACSVQKNHQSLTNHTALQ